MEDWSKDFFSMLDTVASEFEQFFQDVGEIIETVADEVQVTIAAELDQCWQDIFEPIFEIYTEIEFEDGIGETDWLITYKQEPTVTQYSACRGCRHYHGHVYGENILICGMHPYGWDGENCPDWEGGSPYSPDSNENWY